MSIIRCTTHNNGIKFACLWIKIIYKVKTLEIGLNKKFAEKDKCEEEEEKMVMIWTQQIIELDFISIYIKKCTKF